MVLVMEKASEQVVTSIGNWFHSSHGMTQVVGSDGYTMMEESFWADIYANTPYVVFAVENMKVFL